MVKKIKNKITILIPAFNEELSFEHLFKSLEKTTARLRNFAFSYVVVDDGSSDGSISILKKLISRNKKISLIELTRNFGKEIAVTAGLNNCKGDAVIIMDADMQHPPELIPKLIKEWEKGFEIVATKRTNFEKRSILKKLLSHFFYKLMKVISEIDMMSQTTDFRLLDQKVVNMFNFFTERNRMVRGIIDWMGFSKTYIEFEAPARYAGEAVYNYKKLFTLAINSITSFSSWPLKITAYLGILISSLSGIGIILIMLDKAFFNYAKFTLLGLFMMLNTFLSGLALSGLGIVALYIGSIHKEVINRPLYLIKRITGKIY